MTWPKTSSEGLLLPPLQLPPLLLFLARCSSASSRRPGRR